MINKNFQKIIAIGLLSALSLLVFACQPSTPTPKAGGAQTPTEAYKMLYAAVKAKNTEDIKKMMTGATLSLAEMQASQTKQTPEQVLANGFTETMFAASLPNIRDERVKENFGAIEVWNEKRRVWEDLPFIKEGDGWKLAVGDIFKGTYESPGKGQDFREKEAANIADPSRQAVIGANVNSAAVNTNAPQPPAVIKKGKEEEKK